MTSRAPSSTFEQLPYAELSAVEMGLPKDSPPINHSPGKEISGRRIPEPVAFSNLTALDLSSQAVPLPDANTLGQWHYQRRLFGRIRSVDGGTRYFSPQMALVKFRGLPHVAALQVEPMRELESIKLLRARPDVAFAELDFLQFRQFIPNDSAISNQWHHSVIDSFSAWEKSLGNATIRIAIVDTPFQMDHPDLAANVVAGWSVVSNAPVTASAGIAHSTAGAGLAAAVLNNGLGVAGAANCTILPVHINGFTSEMYDAVIWAADNAVRVVNISWTGADSPSLNDAGLYLKNRARGLLAMAGVNGLGFLDYPNHPHIYCISMTDAADNMRSRNGDHIDFAAPGFDVYSTTTGGAYDAAGGTSFSTPLFCGVVASLFGINPTLSPDQVVEIVKSTTDDLGQPGWDRYFGWGRIQFGPAATAAQSTLPDVLQIVWANSEAAITVNFRTGLEYSLWKTSQLSSPAWLQIPNAVTTTNSNLITLTDPNATDSNAYYKVRAAVAGLTP